MFSTDKLKALIPLNSIPLKSISLKSIGISIVLILLLSCISLSISYASTLSQYTKTQGLSPLVDTPTTKLVGITYNAQLKQYITLHNGSNLSKCLTKTLTSLNK